jgi:hypothetical protein
MHRPSSACHLVGTPFGEMLLLRFFHGVWTELVELAGVIQKVASAFYCRSRYEPIHHLFGRWLNFGAKNGTLDEVLVRLPQIASIAVGIVTSAAIGTRFVVRDATLLNLKMKRRQITKG